VRWLRFVLNLPPGGSTFADGVDLLHFAVITVTLLGAAGVAALTLFYIVRYRSRRPAESTARLQVSLLGELGIVGSIVVLFLAFWVVGFRQYVRMETPPEGALVVNVTAKQWMWKFSYPAGQRAIDVLTVPVGRPVKLLMTSRDVIHSFYVPAFRVKQDVLPGRYVTAWFEATAPGSYDVYCAEYCGLSHSRMRAVVHVLTAEDYAAWLDEQRRAPLSESDFVTAGGEGAQVDSDLVALGATVAARRQCLACHTIDGQPHVGPTWRGLYGSTVPLEGGATAAADSAYLTRSMMDPMAEIHAGFKPVMPSYQGVLTVAETAALLEYLKSLRSTGPEPSVVLPPVVPGSASVENPEPPDAGP
jgi:cytochrome c oxidase subunit 2